jgi:hypothetical protein
MLFLEMARLGANGCGSQHGGYYYINQSGKL